MGLQELFDQLNKIIVPGWQTGILLVIAYVVTDVLRRRDTKTIVAKQEPDSPLANNELFQRMLKELSDAKRRETDCSQQIESFRELNYGLTRRVETLERQVSEKDQQISSLFKLMRHRAQPGGSTDSDGSLDDMRQWMVDAFNEGELEIVAADAHLTRPGRGQTPDEISQALIDEAKRRGILPELEEIILAKRPSVKPW